MLAGPFFFTVSQLDISNRDSMQKVMNTIKKEGQGRVSLILLSSIAKA